MRGIDLRACSTYAWPSASHAAASRSQRSWPCGPCHACREQSCASRWGNGQRHIWCPSKKAWCLRDGKGGRLLLYNEPFLLLTSDDGRFTVFRILDPEELLPGPITVFSDQLSVFSLIMLK